jgi:hypothetical protein
VIPSDHGPEQIDSGHDPDESGALQDRQAPDSVLCHEPRSLVSPGLGCHRQDLSGHDLADLDLGAPSPESLLLLGHGEGRGKHQTEIPISDDSDKALPLHDRQVADSMGLDKLHGLPETGVGPNRDWLRSHKLCDRHLPLLPASGQSWL